MTCKETACTSCAHREVCKYKEEFLKAQSAVDEVTVHLSDKRFIRLRDIQWISPVGLRCKHHLENFPGGAIR